MSDFERGYNAERRFAYEHLSNIQWATKKEDMFEHWDVAGDFNGKHSKFDVKALKKINRHDEEFQDDHAWVEGVNVRGDKGWLQGNANYIVFEKNNAWMIVHRQQLFDWTTQQIIHHGYQKGKEPYKIYQRQGRKDKITLIKYSDIPKEYYLILNKK